MIDWPLSIVVDSTMSEPPAVAGAGTHASGVHLIVPSLYRLTEEHAGGVRTNVT